MQLFFQTHLQNFKSIHLIYALFLCQLIQNCCGSILYALDLHCLEAAATSSKLEVPKGEAEIQYIHHFTDLQSSSPGDPSLVTLKSQGVVFQGPKWGGT